MAKTENNKRLAHLSNKIQTGDKQAVLAALHDIKKYGEPNILPVLFELLATTQDEEIYAKTLAILQSLKVSNATPAFLDALLNPKYEEEVPHILSAFWHSNQKIGDNISFFIDLAISGSDYMTSFECLTIIENSDETFTEEDIMDSIQKLQTEIENQHQHSEVLNSIKDSLTERVIG